MKLADGVEFVPGMDVWRVTIICRVFHPPERFKSTLDDADGVVCSHRVGELYSTAEAACNRAIEMFLMDQEADRNDVIARVKKFLERN